MRHILYPILLEKKRVSRAIKVVKSVTMKIFSKKSFLFKSFVKVELSYVFTIILFSTAEK